MAAGRPIPRPSMGTLRIVLDGGVSETGLPFGQPRRGWLSASRGISAFAENVVSGETYLRHFIKYAIFNKC